MENVRPQELEYLRNELNQRLNYSYEHTNKLFGHIILLWGGTLVLLGNAKQGCFIRFDVILFIMATIFFISVVALYLLSQRNDDNLKEISKLASYITIFYEGTPKEETLNEETPTNKKHRGIFWALTTFKVDKKGMGKLRNRFKNEYFWLSSIATCVIVVLFWVMVHSLDEDNARDYFMGAMFWGCLGYIVLSVSLSILIFGHLSLNWEKWRNREKRDLRLFLIEAIKMKYYAAAEDIKDRYGERFYKEIVNEDVQETIDNHFG